MYGFFCPWGGCLVVCLLSWAAYDAVCRAADCRCGIFMFFAQDRSLFIGKNGGPAVVAHVLGAHVLELEAVAEGLEFLCDGQRLADLCIISSAGSGVQECGDIYIELGVFFGGHLFSLVSVSELSDFTGALLWGRTHFLLYPVALSPVAACFDGALVAPCREDVKGPSFFFLNLFEFFRREDG